MFDLADWFDSEKRICPLDRIFPQIKIKNIPQIFLKIWLKQCASEEKQETELTDKFY